MTSYEDIVHWRENYISIGWDQAFDEEHRRFVAESRPKCRLHAEFIDTARIMLTQEACSAYVVERSARTLIASGAVRLVPDALYGYDLLTLFTRLVRHTPMFSRLHWKV